jgi:hypothetical protein
VKAIRNSKMFYHLLNLTQGFTFDKIDETSNKMTLIRLNRETIEEIYREKNLINGIIVIPVF